MEFINRVINRFNLKKIETLVSQSSMFSPTVSQLGDIEIRDKFQSYRGTDLKQVELPYLIALIREVFQRTQGITPYQEQFICALAMYMGHITEMKTGEGKSIAAVIASILCSLHGKVHVATVNDYLAKRDYEKMAVIYGKFGLKSCVNEGEHNKREVYEADVVYSSSMELIFDYVRNQILPEGESLRFPTDTVIIDEVDFVLLDNANSMFSVSTGESYEASIEIFKLAKEICAALKGEEREKEDFNEDLDESNDVHYIFFKHNRTVYLTELGSTFIEKLFNIKDIMSQNLKLYRAIIYTLEANLFYQNGRDYILQNERVVLINKENGRLMSNSQLEEELHTAIEIKEGVGVTHRHLLSNSLSYQIFFTQYRYMVGMSGTVYEAKDEFEELFNTPVAVIPTHRPNKRIDHKDLFFRSLDDKYNYLVQCISKQRKHGQPVLIIAGSEKEAGAVYEMLRPHYERTVNLLNVQKTEDEEIYIRLAGVHDTVTISTNMAGRGTDIILDEVAKDAGGLLVISLNHYESERIDNQVRGRAGRQGENGECLFLVSMEDEIWRHASDFQKKRISSIISKSLDSSSPQENRKLEAILRSIQRSTQSTLFKSRQTIFVLGSIVERQRKRVLVWKEELLNSAADELMKEYISSREFIVDEFKKLWKQSTNGAPLDSENLDCMIEEQYLRLDQSTAQRLFEKLVNDLVNREWLFFKKDMEYLKSYLSFYMLNEEQTIRKYISIVDEQYRLFRKNVMNNLLGYFLTAKAVSKDLA